jgi:hypothetical protein
VAALDLFDADWQHQATAAAALIPLAADPRVAALLRSRLAELGPRAAHYALYLLLVAETEGIDTGVPLTAVARAVETLYEKEIDGDVDLDAFHDGTAAAYRLLEVRHADPAWCWRRPCVCTQGNRPSCSSPWPSASLGREGRPSRGRRSARRRRCTRALISRRSTERSLRAATTSRGEHQAANRRRTSCNQAISADTQRQ